MRLPTRGSATEIDEPLATRMLHYAIDRGVNYVDTAYPYHGGESERFVGRALRGSYREKVRLATKLPCWLVKQRGDLDRYFGEQMERLQTERLDVYMLHGLSASRWEEMRALGALEWLAGLKQSGRVGLIGFSFHDRADVFKTILDGYAWDFCQIQYNYVNEETQAGTEGLRFAAARMVGTVIMEPLLGGMLASPPPPVRAIWEKAGLDPVEMALRWLWSQPEVGVVLSGMSTMEQVEQNVRLAEDGARPLTAAELAVIHRVRDAYKGLRPVPCTGCGYCVPCLHGVDIPTNFLFYNDAVAFGPPALRVSRMRYKNFLTEEKRASACVGCKACEEKCPQTIPISERMPEVHRTLGAS